MCFFANIPGYTKLLLAEQFYQAFADYEYILIYQWTVSCSPIDLEYWCAQKVGITSARHGSGTTKTIPTGGLWAVGNGGLSLRNVSSALAGAAYPKCCTTPLGERGRSTRYFPCVAGAADDRLQDKTLPASARLPEHPQLGIGRNLPTGRILMRIGSGPLMPGGFAPQFRIPASRGGLPLPSSAPAILPQSQLGTPAFRLPCLGQMGPRVLGTPSAQVTFPSAKLSVQPFPRAACSPLFSGFIDTSLTNVPPVGTLVCHKTAARLSTQSPSFNQEKRWPMANETAKIVRFHSVGGPEVLQLDELPAAQAGPLVKYACA